MIVECPKCGKKYKIDEDKYFQGKESVSLKCPGCGEYNKMSIMKDPAKSKAAGLIATPEKSYCLTCHKTGFKDDMMTKSHDHKKK